MAIAQHVIQDVPQLQALLRALDRIANALEKQNEQVETLFAAINKLNETQVIIEPPDPRKRA